MRHIQPFERLRALASSVKRPLAVDIWATESSQSKFRREGPKPYHATSVVHIRVREDFGDDEVEEALFDPLEPQRPSSSFHANEPKNAEEHVARMFGNFAPDRMRLQVWDNERGEREPPTSKGGKFYVWATRHDERGLTAKWRPVSLDVGEPFSLGEVPPAPGHGVLLDPEEPDDWKIHRVLWVPKSAREDFKEELRENRGRVQNAKSPMLDPIWIDDVGTRRGGYSTRRPYTLEILGDESTDDEDDDELELEEMEEGELGVFGCLDRYAMVHWSADVTWTDILGALEAIVNREKLIRWHAGTRGKEIG